MNSAKLVDLDSQIDHGQKAVRSAPFVLVLWKITMPYYISSYACYTISTE
jgi:hypothetical protein